MPKRYVANIIINEVEVDYPEVCFNCNNDLTVEGNAGERTLTEGVFYGKVDSQQGFDSNTWHTEPVETDPIVTGLKCNKCHETLVSGEWKRD
jgi:hypothetical protein